jgi:serine/threonine protein kinase
LIEVFEGGQATELDTLYLILEFVPGKSLDKLVGNIPLEAIPSLVEQLADAAKCLDEKDLVHRDIKPANIVISDDFKKLTLLDLGIVHQIPESEDDPRLSGEEFVASLRYSPPEFVWRKEQADADAWRAVTFYQIGAVIHDMVMGFPIFTGKDKPRGELYDSIKGFPPVIVSSDLPSKLILATRASLIKDWRQRHAMVCWDSFRQSTEESNIQLREKAIKLKQIRFAEMQNYAALKRENAPQPDREHQLWNLKNQVGSEFRTYILSSGMFPQSKIEETKVTNTEYHICTTLSKDTSKGITAVIEVSIVLMVDPQIESATKLIIQAIQAGNIIFEATWTEMYDAQSAFEKCQASMLDILDQLLSEEHED